MEIRLSGNPDNHPMVQADPCVSSNTPSLGSSGELGHPLFELFECFFFREGGSQREGGIDPDAGISPCSNRMGKHAFQTCLSDHITEVFYLVLVGLMNQHGTIEHVQHLFRYVGLPRRHYMNQRYCRVDPKEQISVEFCLLCVKCHSRNCLWNGHLSYGGHFVQT